MLFVILILLLSLLVNKVIKFGKVLLGLKINIIMNLNVKFMLIEIKFGFNILNKFNKMCSSLFLKVIIVLFFCLFIIICFF